MFVNAMGTDEDRMNCPFYLKNGACRYGNQCTRRHIRPTQSRTLLIAHMYQNPPHAIALSEGHHISNEDILKVVEHFEKFYMEVFMEVATFGEIEEMHVVDNIGEHMIGNVYIKFTSEEDADNVRKNLSGRYYSGKLVMPEFSPVTSFKEGRCREFDTGTCKRGGSCNFMHMKKVSKDLLKALYKQMYKENPEYKERYRKDKKTAKPENEDDRERKRRSRSDEKKKSKKHKRDKSRSDEDKERKRVRDRDEESDNERRDHKKKDKKRYRDESINKEDSQERRRKKEKKHRRERSESNDDKGDRKSSKDRSNKHKKERKRSRSRSKDKRNKDKRSDKHYDDYESRRKERRSRDYDDEEDYNRRKTREDRYSSKYNDEDNHKIEYNNTKEHSDIANKPELKEPNRGKASSLSQDDQQEIRLKSEIIENREKEKNDDGNLHEKLKAKLHTSGPLDLNLLKRDLLNR